MEKDIKESIIKIIQFIGENPDRDGLKETPDRMVRMYEELTKGYKMNLEEIVNHAVFSSDYSEMVVVKNIDFFSLCEHHLLPFFGRANVGYIPNGRIIGLSKIPRIVEMFSRRLQVQERMTDEIAKALQNIIEPMGVGVVIEGYHLCSVMRGVKKTNALMVTSSMLGVFRKDSRTRAEFLNLISHKNSFPSKD